MTWELASFALLGLVLVAGFAWYERSHPSARVLALVATLAALAVLGRVAFAPLPNVKPTTDIVLLTGYALGGAPGFAVGAVTALASNVFYGQGPWTPWMMAAWGLVGVGGAALGAVSRRRLPRVPLALCCGAAGLLYGVVMNYSTWVAFSGEHTLGQYAALMGTALPFDIAHAVGNVVFCLAFGPVLVKALLRFRARFEVTWRPAPNATVAAVLAAVALAAGAAALLSPAPARAADPAVGRAVGYLRGAQNADGGFGAAPHQRTSALYTAWATMGLAAAGRRPAGVRHGGRSAADSVTATARVVRDNGDIERTILALVAAGRSPRRAAGRNLVAVLASRQARNGSIEGLVNRTAFFIVALRASGRSTHDRAVRAAVRWLSHQQHRDGGFSVGGRFAPSAIDDTAVAVFGLTAAGGRSRRGTRRAVRFLTARQNLDGGFALVPGGASNAQSTANVVQAFVGAGTNPDRVHRRGARSPLAYLRSLQGPDGAIHYSRTSRQSPVWVTGQALMALARRPMPVGGVRR
jgi:energy-coupling factor transport system substrate-specific component